MTREEIVRRAGALVPRLKDRAAETEALRRLPDETVADLAAAGLLRTDTPERFGGYRVAVERRAAFEVAMELGRACGSTAWVYSQWAIHTFLMGHWPEAAQDEFFAGGPDTRASSGVVPNMAHSERVSGGLRIWGRWQFSSGCDASSWAFLGLPNTPQGRKWALVPRSDYKIEDTWFVSGMRGTGSKDLTIDSTFVPEHRLMDPDRAGDSELTGWRLHGRDSYRVPASTMAGWELVSPLVGIGQGTVDEVIGRLTGRSGRASRLESPALLLRLAEASAEIDAARTVHLMDVRDAIEKGGQGESFSDLDRYRYQRDKAFAARLCVRAVNRLFEASGGHALFESDPMQRHHRDIHAGSHQLRLNWDTFGEAYGRLALGLEPL